ncbi:phage major capsid protein [Amycolatopsis methanolica]|uniref:HK97 family phage major capsid protein n=1 Tax=Amycolatopsis methanolica 239 TaxID=1068978 RepID=A0A076N6F2_AMYME|nr:phage major capsid protein [Amycolatopsis methanolica]AIJ26366.1 HK97 family phage major capsid protein [Amycolatopsis methanolica 239]AIJ26425.1 HK97 family phage major capsid protein [Amycolatopsis methanolica 239]
MSEQLKRLIEEQNTVWKRMCDIRDAAAAENRDLTAEERANWDQAETRLTEVSGDIERLERFAQLETVDRSQVVTSSGAPVGGGDEAAQRYSEAFERYMRGGMDRLSGEQRQLLMENFSELRAQGVSTDTAGGYLVPEGFRAVMSETMKAFGGLLNVATVITTSTGNDLPWPTNDDTGNEGAILGENTQVTEQDVVLGQRKLLAHTYTSKLVRVSLQLLQDSAFDINVWLPRKLGERIGRAVAGHLATGTGTNQPEGITTNITVGKTGAAGQVTSIIYDDLVDLEHSVDPAYRTNARYLLSDSALKMIRKLKDADNRPLWVPVPAPGFPSTINGFPYTIDNKMPVPAASAKSIVFGDIAAGYIVRQVLDVQTLRLTERYADFLQVGFLGFARLDGKPDDAAAIRAYAHPAT